MVAVKINLLYIIYYINNNTHIHTHRQTHTDFCVDMLLTAFKFLPESDLKFCCHFHSMRFHKSQDTPDSD